MTTTEIIQALGDKTIDIISKLVTEEYNTGAIRSSINESIFICLHKRKQ